MDAESKRIADAVLRHLCRGSRIGGIRFGPVLQILINNHGTRTEAVAGQVYLNLASTWVIADRFPDSLPSKETDLPDPSLEEQIRLVCSLQQVVIEDIFVCEERPHLIMRFADGRFLLLNGNHDEYECWQLGVAYGSPDGEWLVVATPGSGLAVWAPDTFASDLT